MAKGKGKDEERLKEIKKKTLELIEPIKKIDEYHKCLAKLTKAMHDLIDSVDFTIINESGKELKRPRLERKYKGTLIEKLTNEILAEGTIQGYKLPKGKVTLWIHNLRFIRIWDDIKEEASKKWGKQFFEIMEEYVDQIKKTMDKFPDLYLIQKMESIMIDLAKTVKIEKKNKKKRTNKKQRDSLLIKIKKK